MRLHSFRDELTSNLVPSLRLVVVSRHPASTGGVVVEVGIYDGDPHSTPYGNYVILDHREGMQTRYAHMVVDPSGLAAGARVAQGDILGGVGTTGYSTGKHLHFELRLDEIAENPRGYLPEGRYS